MMAVGRPKLHMSAMNALNDKKTTKPSNYYLANDYSNFNKNSAKFLISGRENKSFPYQSEQRFKFSNNFSQNEK